MTTFIPDQYLTWLWKQSIRATATCVALGIIAFLLAIVFRAIAFMIDVLHDALHSTHVFCNSLYHTYMQSGLVGQFLISLICLACFGWILYRSCRFLCQSWRAKQ